MKIKSCNEYDPLKSVIVGIADYANFPKNDILYMSMMLQGGWTKSLPPEGPVSQNIIDEANEDLEILADTLKSLDIDVYRPIPINFQEANGQYAYCPRDNLLVIDEFVIEAPMAVKARQIEMECYYNIRREAIQDGAKWIVAPKPRLSINENLSNNGFKLNELEPVFDAANICRFGNDLLYLVSNTANRIGAEWLQNVLGSEYRVHVTNVYNSAHIDSTIVPISNDTVVLNASRVNEKNLPEFLKDWKKIYITEDMVTAQKFEGYPYASKWIGINMLAIGNQYVICDKNQPHVIHELEKHHFEVIPLELRHARTLGGGFHCVTLDLERS